MTREHTIGKRWAFAFGTWFLGFLAFELMFYHIPDWRWFLVYITVVWLTIELLGAGKKRRYGDTWSQFMWWFGEKGWSRRIMTTCLTEAIVFRAGTLAWLEAGVMNDFIRYGPWAIIFLGIGGWVFFHIGQQNEAG